MAFTPEQEAKMKALWDQGVRDHATLLGAINVSKTQTQIAPTTPQGVVPAPMPEDRWRYPDFPREPGDVGFIEGGGVLGAAARAPVIGQALGALGWFGENVYDPFATSTLYGIQKLLPGEQELEKTFETAFNSAENADKNWIARTWAGLEAGAEAESGFVWNNPDIKIPEWIAGPDVKIETIDVGRLAAELPLDFALGKGATKLYRMARPKKLPDPETVEAKVETPDSEINIEAPDAYSANAVAEDVAETIQRVNPADPTPRVAYVRPDELEAHIVAQQRASRRAAAKVDKELNEAVDKLGKKISAVTLASKINKRNKIIKSKLKNKKNWDDQKLEIDEQIIKAQEELDEATQAIEDIVIEAGTYPNGVQRIRIDDNWDAVDGKWTDAYAGTIPAEFKERLKEAIEFKQAKATILNTKKITSEKMKNEDINIGGTPANLYKQAIEQQRKLSLEINPDKEIINNLLTKTYDIAGRAVPGAALLSILANKRLISAGRIRNINAYKKILDDPDIANTEVVDKLTDLVTNPDVTLITVREPRSAFSTAQNARIDRSVQTLRESIASTQENFREVANEMAEDPIGTRRSGNPQLHTIHDPTSDFNGQQTANPIKNVTSESTDDLPVRESVLENNETPDPDTIYQNGGRYISGFEKSIVPAARRMFRQSERALIANYVTKGILGGSGVGFFHKSIANLLDKSVGSVNRWWVSNSWAQMVIAAAESKLQSISNRANQDINRLVLSIVTNAPGRVTPQMGIRGIPASFRRGSPARKNQFMEFYDSYPVYQGTNTSLKGQWGKQEYLDAVARGDESAVYANDLFEMYNAHMYAQNLSISQSEKLLGSLFLSGKKYVKDAEGSYIIDPDNPPRRQFRGDELVNGKKTFDYKKLFYGQDGNPLSWEQRNSLFDELFNKTTMYGSEQTRFTLDSISDALTETMLLVDNALEEGANIRGRRLMPRDVISFANGKRSLSRSSEQSKRFYASIAEGVAAGVDYNFNPLVQIQLLTKEALRARILREFRAVVTDPDVGFAIEEKGLIHTIAKLKDKNPIEYENLNKDAKEFVEKAINLINKAEVKKEIALTRLDKEYAELNDIVEETAQAKAGVKTVTITTTEFNLPSNLITAKPRYNIGSTPYLPDFESDIDKALFIVAQVSKSAQDDKYMAWLKNIFPDLSEHQIRMSGRQVRDHIKTTVSGQPDGEIFIPASEILKPKPQTITRPVRNKKTPKKTTSQLKKEKAKKKADIEKEFANEMDEADETIRKLLIKTGGSQAKGINDLPGLTIPGRMFFANNTDNMLSFKQMNTVFGFDEKILDPLKRVGLNNLIVDIKTLKLLQQSFKGMESLVGTSPQLAGPGAVARGFSNIADFWRLTSTGFDLAFSMTIGLPLLFRDPLRWKRITEYQFSAFYNPNWMAGALRRDPEFMNKIQRLVDMGLGTGDNETFKYLMRDGRIDINSYLDYIQTPVDIKGGNPFTRKFYSLAGAFQRSYNAGALNARVMWLEILEPKYADEFGNVSAQARQSLKHEISNLTGAYNTTDVGKSIGSKTIENMWVGLSPRLTRATASVFADAIAGIAYIAKTGGTDGLGYGLSGGRFGFKSPLQKAMDKAKREGRELTPDEVTRYSEITKQVGAVHNLGSILTVSMGTFYITSYTYYRNQGYSHEQANNMSLDSMDPRQGKKFLSIQMNGAWYGIGGFWRSLASMYTKLLYGAQQAVMENNWEPLSKWKSIDQFENPLLHVLRSRGAPAMNFGGTTAEYFFGVDAAPYEVVESLPELAKYGGESFLPFVLQGFMDGDSVAAAGAGFFGARTSMASLSDVVTEKANKYFDINVTSTREIAESWIKNDLVEPDVIQEHALEARDSNSAWGLFYRRKKALEKEFLETMNRQWAASASDYQMRSIYFEQKKLMNTKLEEYKRSVGIEDDRKKSNDPIKQALNAWYALYDSPEAQQAAISDKWDVIDVKREALLATFTPEQRGAVLRAGSGIHQEILELLKPESQQKYLERFQARAVWITENASSKLTEDEVQQLIARLWDNMFEKFDSSRGPIPVAERRTRSGGTPGLVTPSSKIIML